MRTQQHQAIISGLHRIPVLQKDEERELTRAYCRSRDPGLARRLLEGNLRFVISMVKTNAPSAVGTSLEDLVQEGCIGLLKAIKKYDPDRGVRLTSYASYWIRAQILNAAVRSSRLLRIVTTRGHKRLFFSLERTAQKLAQKGLSAEPADLARELEMPVAVVSEMMTRLRSKEVDLADAGDVPDHALGGMVGPLEFTLQREAQARVRRALAALEPLTDRDRAICDERLMADEPVTLQCLAERFGLCRERIRQLEQSLKTRLREQLADGTEPSDEPAFESSPPSMAA